MGIPERLQEERKRLAMTQAALADAIGATKRSVINWETGASSPAADVIARYGELGADVLYIVTGERSRPVAEGERLPPRERLMLDNFRAAPEGVQAGVCTTLAAFAPGGAHVRKKRGGKAA